MSIFGNLTNEGLEETQDRVGGFSPHESDIYLGTIKMAYAGQSDGGARNVTLVLDLDGKEYRETIYITNKKGENFFLNKQDNTKKVPLPGFTTIDDLCLVTTNQPLAAQTTEDKMVNIYDYEAKADKPTSVPMIMPLIGQKAYFAILKQIEDKNQKDSAGNYVPTGETRETNTIDKVFHDPSKMTVVEARNGAEEPVFFDTWLERNKGQTRNRSQAAKGGGQTNAGTPGGGAPAAGGGGAPRQSLFGNK